MLNNWMFGSQPVKVYLLFVLLNPRWTGCHDGVRTQTLGFVSRAKHPICYGVVLFNAKAVFSSVSQVNSVSLMAIYGA